MASVLFDSGSYMYYTKRQAYSEMIKIFLAMPTRIRAYQALQCRGERNANSPRTRTIQSMASSSLYIPTKLAYRIDRLQHSTPLHIES
jgi:hypothetical protein